VYHDGVLKQTDVAQDSYDLNLITGSLTSGLPLTIMQDATGAYAEDFSALLDNIRIWNRVITQQEVTDIFQNDKGSGIGGETEIIVGTETDKVEAFQLYPNPSRNGKINLAFSLPQPSDMRLTLMNNQGNHVNSWIQPKGETEGTVSMESTYEPGLYFLRVETNQTRKILKIIIAK
jgi:hypothetical protein